MAAASDPLKTIRKERITDNMNKTGKPFQYVKSLFAVLAMIKSIT